MRPLKHHPSILMRNDAADALDALEDKYGPIIINRGSVSEAVQQGLIDRWNKGGPANRPPFLYQPKSPARSSDHVQGIGLDVYNYTDDRAKLKEFGYEWYGKSDPVHYTFRGWNKPKPVPPPVIEEDDDMPVTVGWEVSPKSGRYHFYTVDNEFISHNVSDNQKKVTRNVNSVRDEEHKLSPEDFKDYLDGMGIPRDAVDMKTGKVLNPESGAYEANGTWSRDREGNAQRRIIIEKLEKLLEK